MNIFEAVAALELAESQDPEKGSSTPLNSVNLREQRFKTLLNDSRIYAVDCARYMHYCLGLLAVDPDVTSRKPISSLRGIA